MAPTAFPTAAHLTSRTVPSGGGPSPHGAAKRVATALAVLVLSLGLVTGAAVGRAHAAPSGSPVQLSITASSATEVGLQVFANVNVGGGVNNPSGSLTFSLFGPSDTTCTAAPLFVSTVAMTGASVNSAHYTTTNAGTYRWEASYSGDASNAPVGPTACSNPSAAVIVSPAYTSLAVTAPGLSGGTLRASAVLFGDAPTGSVTFYLTPPGDTFCSGVPVFTSTVAVNGSATYLSAPYVPVVGGQYKWRATYTGDANNMAQPVTACLDRNAAVTIAAPPAVGLVYPVNGQSNLDTSAPFTWQPAPQAQGYFVMVGTTKGGWDLSWSGVLPATQTSYAVPGLPSGPLWATFYTEVGNSWSSQEVSFTAIPTEAGLTSPTNGQVNVGPVGTFTWSTVNGVSGVQGYALWLSTVYGGASLFNTGLLSPTTASYTPPAMPAGQTVYVLLLTLRNGTWTAQAINIATGGT